MANIEEILGRDIAHKSDYVLTATGDLDTISGLENIKNALFHRLITSPGSLIHRPNYGVGIKDFQGAPNTIDVKRQMALKIQEQFEQDPRVESVLGVSINSDDLTPEKTEVIVRVRVQGYDELSASFLPFGEGV